MNPCTYPNRLVGGMYSVVVLWKKFIYFGHRRNIMATYTQSRFWALFTFHWWPAFIFPAKMSASANTVEHFKRRGVILFWLVDEERMSGKQISSVRVKKGIFWDTVSVDTTGGSNVIELKGMKKSNSNKLRDEIQQVIMNH